MFDKVVRHFYDDTCVVPEKGEGQFSQNSQRGGELTAVYPAAPVVCAAGDIKHESGLYREGPSYQRRGSLQLWQFLVALLDDPSNSHFIAWTGRGMEFKLIEPEEVRPSVDTDTTNKQTNTTDKQTQQTNTTSQSIQCWPEEG